MKNKKTRKKRPMSAPVHTITFNSKKVKKDEKVMQLVNEYVAVLDFEDIEPKPALAHFINRTLPNEIARLRAKKKRKTA